MCETIGVEYETKVSKRVSHHSLGREHNLYQRLCTVNNCTSSAPPRQVQQISVITIEGFDESGNAVVLVLQPPFTTNLIFTGRPATLRDKVLRVLEEVDKPIKGLLLAKRADYGLRTTPHF